MSWLETFKKKLDLQTNAVETGFKAGYRCGVTDLSVLIMVSTLKSIQDELQEELKSKCLSYSVRDALEFYEKTAKAAEEGKIP